MGELLDEVLLPLIRSVAALAESSSSSSMLLFSGSLTGVLRWLSWSFIMVGLVG